MDSRIRLRWLAMGPEAGGGQCSRWMALFRRSCVLGPVARCAIEDETPGIRPDLSRRSGASFFGSLRDLARRGRFTGPG